MGHMDLYLQSYNHTIEYVTVDTLGFRHTPNAISSPWGECCADISLQQISTIQQSAANHVQPSIYMSESVAH